MTTHLIANVWTPGDGDLLRSLDPATGESLWEGAAAGEALVDAAVHAARQAAHTWASSPVNERIALLQRFAGLLDTHRHTLAETICREVGKPKWEALTEVAAMIGKVDASIDAFRERAATTQQEIGPGVQGVTRFKPHGVLAVFGPFNFPGHLPNGHIVPALLAGNTVVFKPSEQTPAIAEATLNLWLDAGLPAGVLNLVQGAKATGVALANHPHHDGLLFTGSFETGLALRRALVDRPEKILALEMGGNNPLIVHDTANLDAAAYLTVHSAYATAGQRCTCARRLIIPHGTAGDAFIARLVRMIQTIRVGPWTDQPEPFMGPVIAPDAAAGLLETQQTWLDAGANPILPMASVPQSPHGAMLRPGLIDVTALQAREDKEVFGPLLQLIRVADFDAAIDEANATAYGLVAGLISDDPTRYERFYRRARAGLVNFNRPTTGASGRLPFGGVGKSGNHRPSGYFAVDYCVHPVASLESAQPALPSRLSPGIET